MIVSSTHTISAPQRDGRVYVRESHADTNGVVHVAEYLTAPGVEYLFIRTARALALNAALAEAEAEAVIGRESAIFVSFQTLAEFATRLRAKYRDANREEAARLATWILNRLDAGHITDAQVRAAFGLNVAQWTALKTKMTDMRLHYNAVQSAQGE